MGLLQLVLLNLQVWYGHFWVQLSLVKGGVSINKFLAQVKTNRFSSRSRSRTCIYLIPTPIAPHLNIRLMPCYAATPCLECLQASFQPGRRIGTGITHLSFEGSNLVLMTWRLVMLAASKCMLRIGNLHYIDMKYFIWIAM